MLPAIAKIFQKNLILKDRTGDFVSKSAPVSTTTVDLARIWSCSIACSEHIRPCLVAAIRGCRCSFSAGWSTRSSRDSWSRRRLWQAKSSSCPPR